MPHRQYIKIIGEHRKPNDNEFFFSNNPFVNSSSQWVNGATFVIDASY